MLLKAGMLTINDYNRFISRLGNSALKMHNFMTSYYTLIYRDIMLNTDISILINTRRMGVTYILYTSTVGVLRIYCKT